MLPPSGTFPRLDELVRPYLQEGRSTYFTLLLGATFVVAAGVIIEGWDVIKEITEDTKRHRYRPPRLTAEGLPIVEQHFEWLKILGLVGWLLVSIGVVGEFWLEQRLSTFDAGIRIIDDEVLQDARFIASAANERTAELNKEAELLRKQAEDEQLERIRLAETISWRTPDRALIPSLAPRLRRFAEQRYAFDTDASDPERSTVLGWIGLLLGAANWRLEPAPASDRSVLTFQATNIVLWVSPTARNNVLDAARALIPALETAKLPAVVLQSDWGPPPDAAPPELIRVVIFKKGPRMHIAGNRITFEGSPMQMFFGPGPPHSP